MSSCDRIQKALDSLLYLPHLQAQHNEEASLPVVLATPNGSAAGKGRPWDRADLFRRLATFRSSTWFCKPAAISPVECARRGWTNTGPDLLSCEFCKAKLSCPTFIDLPPQQAQDAAQQYAARLGEAHDAACPWRTATSSLSLLQFPPLTEEAVLRDFEARCAALQRLACLPPVAPEPYDTLAAACSKHQLDRLLLAGPAVRAADSGSSAAGEPVDARASVLEGVAALGSPQFEARARMLAVCGWDLKLLTAGPLTSAALRESTNGQQHLQQQQQQQQGEQQLPSLVGPESAVLQCSLCSAKGGLWTFFPQCKALVLAPPRRKGVAAAQRSTASVGRAVSRHVAVDLGTTIAGGSMHAAGEPPSAAPFGSAAQQPAFGFGSTPIPGAGAAVADAPAELATEDGQVAGQSSAPFGGGDATSVPVFGFAALQAAKPAAPAGCPATEAAGNGTATLKRKQPDFSWEAVLADIDAKAAVAKRSKAAEEAAGSGPAAPACQPAAGSAAAAAAGAGRPGGQQQVAAAAVIAAKYRAAAVSPLDPLSLHRPFCPWTNCSQAGEREARCGWRWCLQQLTAPALAPGAADEMADAADDGEAGGNGKAWDPAQLLRNVLQQVDVHK